MEQPSFSEIVRTHRKAASLTQKELADLAGVGKTAVWQIEAGKETIQLNILLAVLNALNIRMELISPLMETDHA